ncbi:NAD(P)/FAD-dependent oxidoreductase [Williamsia sterculiae]|uniref:Glycine/D-amino acid oxidase n=1 Tax=Williamsia sterculiae TaxID=1344003 RepID=A0A1N7DSP5_9NOCA|nr:FAD-binding oxidoreductase [Williamsia sterculiae]SIR78856.1 Glycine/D-amino acid oxidase [Williamsia sterculiae]
MRNGDVSFWWADLGAVRPRPPLPGDLDADIAIVGGGLTGLWTAYYLRRSSPDARIAVFEQRFCGFGASGRNGGWLSAEVAGNRSRYARIARSRGQDGAAANRQLTATMQAGVREVLARIHDEDIDCDAEHSGVLFLARCAAQRSRLAAHLDHEAEMGDTDWQLLSRSDLDTRLRVSAAQAGAWSPHCARVQPAKLSRGVADAVERSGVEIYEQTRVADVDAGRVVTDRGTVRAPIVLVCVEGFTATLPRRHRSLLPLNSAMVVTEPLPDRVWDEIGWRDCELLGEMAHAYTYSQRTADGRIALGGRGIPYRFGSAIDHDGVTQPPTATALTTALRELFPAAADVPIAHTWCGVLGVHRDWSASIRYDPRTGMGSAAGYVGSGLTTTNVAARTLHDLVLGHETELTSLPWVGHRPRRWEPEPLRYLGVAGMYAAYRTADRRELRGSSSRTDVVARIADRISGRG